jgi:hypothetical protein
MSDADLDKERAAVMMLIREVQRNHHAAMAPLLERLTQIESLRTPRHIMRTIDELSQIMIVKGEKP